MKRRISFVIGIFLLCIQGAIAQTYIVQVKTVDSRRWGYANISGEIIIEPQFKKCYEFSRDGYATIYHPSKERYMFININGEVLSTEIIDFTFKTSVGSTEFRNGLLPICQGGFDWGYLGINGKVAIPIKYDFVSVFNNGYAAAKQNGEWGLINKKGEWVIEPIYAGMKDVVIVD